jgi:predicted membrane protein
VLLIFLGLAHILRPSASRCLVSGSIWIGIGTVILLNNLGLIGFDIWDLWPLLLVLLGLSLLTKAFRRDRAIPKEATDTFEATAVLGAVTRRIAASAFRGGNATAILGACDIDLYDSIPDGETAEINTLSVLGGIEIRVPRDWEVQVKGTAILGAFEDKTIPVDGPVAKRLIIRGTAILAGVEIKS